MVETERPWEQPKAKGRRVKRRQVQAGDGWTVVTHASGHSRGSGGNGEEMVLQEARPSRVVEGLTVAKLIDEFGKCEKRWRDTECAKQVEAIFAKRKWDIKEAICVGIGSFSVDWEHRYRSMWQLVLFMAVVELATKEGRQIRLCAQEPAFNSLDKSFLAALDINVLPSDAESRIVGTSFIFAPFVDWFILLPIFLKNKDPDLYIGNEILDDYSQYAKSEEKERALEECNEIGKAFIEGRECVRVPDFALHAHALNGLVVYWQEDSKEGD